MLFFPSRVRDCLATRRSTGSSGKGPLGSRSHDDRRAIPTARHETLSGSVATPYHLVSLMRTDLVVRVLSERRTIRICASGRTGIYIPRRMLAVKRRDVQRDRNRPSPSDNERHCHAGSLVWQHSPHGGFFSPLRTASLSRHRHSKG